MAAGIGGAVIAGSDEARAQEVARAERIYAMRSKRLEEELVLAEPELQKLEEEVVEFERLEGVRDDLVRRGLSEEQSEVISMQLCESIDCGTISDVQYDALIDGAVLATNAVHGASSAMDLCLGAQGAGDGASVTHVREIERMMQGFAGELEKLDESLEVLSAYVRRMRKSPAAELEARGAKTLH
jgi:hypothetical protein